MKRPVAIIQLAVVAIVLAGPWTFGGEVSEWFSDKEAQAVVGRPLTPVSVAGVARRTSRRTTRRVEARDSAAATTTLVTTLPAGCVKASVGGATQYTCGATRYRPQYDGPNLVYVAVP